MTIKSQLRAAKNPAAFIDCAKQAFKQDNDPNLIIPEHFGEMTAMIFEEVYSDSAKHFNAMHGFAHNPRQRDRLFEPFYRAAQAGFAHVSVGTRLRRQAWPEFFSGVSTTIRSDKKLTAIVNRETVAKALPGLVWAVDPSREATEAATGIIKALGGIPEAICGLDPDLVDTLVRQHLEQEEHAVLAAPKLMELRESEPFREAIVARENAAGFHLAACEKQVSEFQTLTLVLEFDRVRENVQVYQLERRRGHWLPSVLRDSEDGACRAHNEEVADVLLDYSLKPLPKQEWVKPIAERVAFEIV
jgi:hypothetical protein